MLATRCSTEIWKTLSPYETFAWKQLGHIQLWKTILIIHVWLLFHLCLSQKILTKHKCGLKLVLISVSCFSLAQGWKAKEFISPGNVVAPSHWGKLRKFGYMTNVLMNSIVLSQNTILKHEVSNWDSQSIFWSVQRKSVLKNHFSFTRLL